jgi:hypothetical protein
MRYDWKVSQGGRYVDSGTIEADTSKEAMGLVLLAQEEERKAGKRQPDKSYSIKCGDSMMSSFGDEFVRSAECTSWTAEPEMDGGGFIAPSLADVGIDSAKALEKLCAHEWMPSGFGEEKCDACGALRDKEFVETVHGITAEESTNKMLDQCQQILHDNGWENFPPVDRAPGGLVPNGSFPFIPDADDFIADKIFPKYKGTGLLHQNFHGKQFRRVVEMIQVYGYRPEEVVSVIWDVHLSAYQLGGMFTDRDGSEKWWSLMVSEEILRLY